ncbi:MAG: hypothetical protein ACTSXL_00185 [Alphaproteobacteria bacterium]
MTNFGAEKRLVKGEVDVNIKDKNVSYISVSKETKFASRSLLGYSLFSIALFGLDIKSSFLGVLIQEDSLINLSKLSFCVIFISLVNFAILFYSDFKKNKIEITEDKKKLEKKIDKLNKVIKNPSSALGAVPMGGFAEDSTHYKSQLNDLKEKLLKLKHIRHHKIWVLGWINFIFPLFVSGIAIGCSFCFWIKGC